MKKIISSLTILILWVGLVQGQQIKRSTLTSTGTLKTIEPFRVSWTAGSCPGCNVLHPNDPPNTGYLRQGFQQPTFNGNLANCPSLTPSFTIIPVVSTVCGTKIDFEYSGVSVSDMAVEWDFGDGAVPKTSNLLNPTGIYYSSAGTKIISLKVSSGVNCSEARAKTLEITTDQIGFSANVLVTNVKCKNEKNGSIKLIPTISSGSKTYRWSTGAATQDLVSVAAGRYSVTMTDNNGCSFAMDTVVSQPLSPVAMSCVVIPESCKDYADGAVQLTVTGGVKPYHINWSTGATIAEIDNLIAGKYSVSIKDSNNCTLDSTFVINRRCQRDTSVVQIYDVITPNGDGKNDRWVVPNIDKFPNNELFIYNRWGQIVYTVKGYRSDWAGTNQSGDELPSAAYYYIFRLNDDKQTVWDGSVTVLR